MRNVFEVSYFICGLQVMYDFLYMCHGCIKLLLWCQKSEHHNCNIVLSAAPWVFPMDADCHGGESEKKVNILVISLTERVTE